jgi:hypothetical protein
LSNNIKEVDSLRDVLRLKTSRKNSVLKDNSKHVAEAISNSLKDLMPRRMDKVSGSKI